MTTRPSRCGSAVASVIGVPRGRRRWAPAAAIGTGPQARWCGSDDTGAGPPRGAQRHDQAASPSAGPSRIAGARREVSGTCSTTYPCVRGPARGDGLPSGAMIPVMPLVEATATCRPVSIARTRVMSNCWSSWLVRMKVALEVCTTMSRAPERAGRRALVVRHVEADRVGDRAPEMSKGSRRVPACMSRATWASSSKAGRASCCPPGDVLAVGHRVPLGVAVASAGGRGSTRCPG